MCPLGLDAHKSSLTLLGLLTLPSLCNAVRFDLEKVAILEESALAATKQSERDSDATVIVWVLSATGLPVSNASGKPSPFCTVDIKSDYWDTSAWGDTTIAPNWTEQHTFINYDCTSPVTFNVYTEDDKRNALGVATVGAEDFRYKPFGSDQHPAQLTLKNPRDGSEIKESMLAVGVRLSPQDACSTGQAEVSVKMTDVDDKSHGQAQAQATQKSGPEVGDTVKVTEENDRIGKIIKIDHSHGDQPADWEVRVQFEDGKEDWFEEADVVVIHASAYPGHEGNDVIEEKEADKKPKNCKEWTKEMLPSTWEEVPSRRRPNKTVFHNENHRTRVSSVKRACEYEQGIVAWHD